MDLRSFANTNKVVYEKRKEKGRTSGVKNLKKVDGGYVNQYGVFFTEQEKKKLKSSVDSVNRKQKRYKESGSMLLMAFGYNEQGKLQEEEALTIAQEHSKGLQQFQSKQAYNNYMLRLNNVKNRKYTLEGEVAEMKRRYLESLETVYGGVVPDDELKNFKEQYNKMSLEEFAYRIQNGAFAEITYMYSNEEVSKKWATTKIGAGISDVDVKVKPINMKEIKSKFLKGIKRGG